MLILALSVVFIIPGLLHPFTNPPVPNNSQVTYSYTSSVQSATEANDFTLPVVGPNGLTYGQTFTLSSTLGEVVLLEFMEPWCPHCQDMAPVLNSLYTNYSGTFVFVTVSGPWQGVDALDVANFIHTYGTNWTYVFDSSGSVMSEYGITSTPTFFIIGKNGSIFATYEGKQTFDTLRAGLVSALTAS
jgi:cytochrome c-type biogenesis protein